MGHVVQNRFHSNPRQKSKAVFINLMIILKLTRISHKLTRLNNLFTCFVEKRNEQDNSFHATHDQIPVT